LADQGRAIETIVQSAQAAMTASTAAGERERTEAIKTGQQQAVEVTKAGGQQMSQAAAGRWATIKQ
jgi:hypothetical protein